MRQGAAGTANLGGRGRGFGVGLRVCGYHQGSWMQRRFMGFRFRVARVGLGFRHQVVVPRPARGMQEHSSTLPLY